MRWGRFVILLCGVLVIGSAPAWAAEPAKSGGAARKAEEKTNPVNAKCPVMEEKDAKQNVTIVRDGKLIAFCCKKCVREFNKDPQKYMKKVVADGGTKGEKAKGEQPAGAATAVNKMCPVHKENAVDETVTTEYEGKTIGFCCEDCLKQFDSDPAAYSANLK